MRALLCGGCGGKDGEEGGIVLRDPHRDRMAGDPDQEPGEPQAEPQAGQGLNAADRGLVLFQGLLDLCLKFRGRQIGVLLAHHDVGAGRARHLPVGVLPSPFALDFPLVSFQQALGLDFTRQRLMQAACNRCNEHHPQHEQQPGKECECQQAPPGQGERLDHCFAPDGFCACTVTAMSKLSSFPLSCVPLATVIGA